MILGVIFLQGCAHNLSIRDDLPGTWGWAHSEHRCDSGSTKYSFSEDGRQLYASSPGPMYLDENTRADDSIYEIIDELPTVMRMRIIGEVRKTDQGQLVVWDLVLKDKDTFCWHRTDWPAGACTKNLTRCERDI